MAFSTFAAFASLLRSPPCRIPLYRFTSSPLYRRCPRLPSYNRAKGDRGRLAALRSYFSPDTLLSVCVKGDLATDCFRIIRKKVLPEGGPCLLCATATVQN